MEEKNRIKIIVVIFITVVITGMLGYMILLKISMLDALYMTVITISTVGYKEVTDMNTGAKVFSMILIFMGVGIVGYAFTNILIFFVEGKMRSIWRGGVINSRIKNLHDHYIICGAGEIGEVVINNFKEKNVPFVVIDTDVEKLKHLQDNEILTMNGDPTHDHVLNDLQISKSKGLVCTLPEDVDNIVTVLTARSLNPDLEIVSVSIENESEPKLLRAGANKVLSINEIGGKKLAAMMLKPNIVTFVEVITRIGDEELTMEEVVVEVGSKLDGVTLREAKIPQATGLSILAIKYAGSEKMTFNPPSSSTMNAGDILLALGKEEQVLLLENMAK